MICISDEWVVFGDSHKLFQPVIAAKWIVSRSSNGSLLMFFE
jgi:hypothetical protein